MGLLFAATPHSGKQEKQEDELYHRLQCRACPLDKIKSNHHPHMAPTGSDKPVVYILGEAPGKDEDETGEQFVGDSGQLLRARIPRAWRSRLRFNNCVRTRPPKNRTPERIEIECCRPSVQADIERTKPEVILGFGNIPLNWISGFSGVTKWRGRRMPVRVGSHTCWYYPMLHPAYLLRQGRGGYTSEEEKIFRLDMARVFADLEEGLPAPWVPTEAEIFERVEVVEGHDAAALRRIEVLLRDAAAAPLAGIDYETNCLRPYQAGAKVLSAGVSTAEISFAFGIDHPEAKWSSEHRAHLIDLWKRFLKLAKCRKIVHNLAFELEWTGVMFGTDLLRAGQWEDTANQACILDERKGDQKPGCFALEFLIQQHFGFNLKKLSNVDRAKLASTSLSRVLKYNALDAKAHRWLFEAQDEELERQRLQEPYRLARRRVPTVILSQIKGVPVDQTEVKRLIDKYQPIIDKIEAQIAGLPIVKTFKARKGVDFNPQAPGDAAYIYDVILKRPEIRVVDKWSKKEKVSADANALKQLAAARGVKDDGLAQMLLDVRAAYKRKSVYLDPLAVGTASSVVFPDGMLHAQFNTIFAETGRLSCEGPNLQNWPKRSEEAKEVRRPISAPPGCVILAFDYGQIEARVIAMFSKDKSFCKALWERYDVHMEWAERLARAYPDRVGGDKHLKDKKIRKAFRTDIKNQWTFPLFFGAKLSSAAGYLKIPEDKIREEFKLFWRQFAGVKEWQERTLDFYEQHGYVEMLTKRRRRGPLSLNQVINSPIQGTAAEIVLDAMSRLSETGDPMLQPEINIHDDLTFLRVPVEDVERITEKVVDIMLSPPFDWINVPITAELSVGSNWMDMEEVATYSSDEWFKSRA